MVTALLKVLQGGKKPVEPTQVQSSRQEELKKRTDSNRQLRVATNQVLAVGQQLSVSIDESQEFSEQLFASARKMAAQNRETQGELQRMAGEFQTVVERLDQIKLLSNAMGQTGKVSETVLQESLAEIMAIVSEIHQIHDATQRTVTMMNELHQLSGAITGILDTVAEISDQTKLLAFNAAIEAARAGDAGSGFNVVADRIKRLSDDSQGSVKNIRKLVAQIAKANQQVNQQMEHTAGKVAGSVERFGKVEENLEKIQSSFEGLVEKSETVNQEISQEQKRALALQNQAEALQALSELALHGVESVYGGLKRHHGLMDELNDLGQRLNQAASTLQPLIAQDSDYLELKSEVQQRAVGIIAYLQQELAGTPDLVALDPGVAAAFLKQLLAKRSELEAAWINDAKGRFVCSIPAAGIANAKVREWFVSSMQGQDFITVPYISAITGQPCVTIAIPIFNVQKEVKGVLGVDLQC